MVFPYQTVRRVRSKVPHLDGFRQIAEGSFARVYTKPGYKPVRKLTVDRCHYEYLTDRFSPKGRFKPRVLHDFGAIGECEFTEGTLYLVEIERLYPIQYGSANYRLRALLYEFASEAGNRGLGKVAKMMHRVDPLLVPRGFRAFMQDLQRFIEDFGITIDFHDDNLMQRADGTFVFSDPVYSSDSPTF
jgi:hypothetical protein